jgi:hypothetical protein
VCKTSGIGLPLCESDLSEEAAKAVAAIRDSLNTAQLSIAND